VPKFDCLVQVNQSIFITVEAENEAVAKAIAAHHWDLGTAKGGGPEVVSVVQVETLFAADVLQEDADQSVVWEAIHHVE